jgi:hypothetical protein
VEPAYRIAPEQLFFGVLLVLGAIRLVADAATGRWGDAEITLVVCLLVVVAVSSKRVVNRATRWWREHQ